MADTKAKITLTGDTAIELDVLKGTLGQDVIDIRSLGSKGVFTLTLVSPLPHPANLKSPSSTATKAFCCIAVSRLTSLLPIPTIWKSVTSCCTAKNRRRKSMTSSERQSPAIR